MRLCLFSTNTGVGIGNLDAEDFGLLQDVNSLAAADVVCDLSGIRGVVHEQQLNVLNVGHNQTTVTVGHQVAGLRRERISLSSVLSSKINNRSITDLLVRSETDLGHGHASLETTADSTVNTTGLAP